MRTLPGRLCMSAPRYALPELQGKLKDVWAVPANKTNPRKAWRQTGAGGDKKFGKVWRVSRARSKAGRQTGRC